MYSLVFAGRLTAQKNPLGFLSTIDKLVHKDINVSAVMLGQGELERDCKQFISAHELEKNVTVLGFVNNPYDYMNEGAVLFMPSRWEGFGLVAVEALAFGMPVVANPVGGLADIVTEKCGYLSADEDENVEEIRRLLTDNEYYNTKSRLAKQRASELENIEAYMLKLEKIYAI